MTWPLAVPASCDQLATWTQQLPATIYDQGSSGSSGITAIQNAPFTTEQVTAAIQGFGAYYASADHNANCGNVQVVNLEQQSMLAAPFGSTDSDRFADRYRGLLILGILLYLQSLDVTPRMQAMNILFGGGYGADQLDGLAFVTANQAQIAMGASGQDSTNAWANVAAWLSIAALVQIPPTPDLLTIVVNFAAGTAMANGQSPPTNVQAAAIQVLAGQTSTDPAVSALLQRVLDAVGTSGDSTVQSAAALLRANIYNRLANVAAGSTPPGSAPATTAAIYWPYVKVIGGALVIGGAIFGGVWWFKRQRSRPMYSAFWRDREGRATLAIGHGVLAEGESEEREKKPMSAAKQRERFDRLRARWLAAREKYQAIDRAASLRYGSSYQKSWLSAGDRTKQDRARDAMDKAGSAFFDHVQSISPRDWSHGVPAHWIYEHLSYEDAVRPKSERLSVVPPLSYGATHPISG